MSTAFVFILLNCVIYKEVRFYSQYKAFLCAPLSKEFEYLSFCNLWNWEHDRSNDVVPFARGRTSYHVFGECLLCFSAAPAHVFLKITANLGNGIEIESADLSTGRIFIFIHRWRSPAYDNCTSQTWYYRTVLCFRRSHLPRRWKSLKTAMKPKFGWVAILTDSVPNSSVKTCSLYGECQGLQVNQ